MSSSNGLEKFPKLRFKGFSEPWEHVKLSDFVSRVTRKNSDNQTDIPLTISSKDGLINQNEFFSKQVASKDMSGYYLLQRGEFAYNKSYSVGFDFGSIKRLEKYEQGALSTLYICFTLNRFDSDFIKHYFDSLKWYREIYMISAEGARNHGLLNVPTEDFFATLHTLPMDTAEQRKIAEFLDLLTTKIEKQHALVDNLKKYKRGASNSFFNDKAVSNSSSVLPFGQTVEINPKTKSLPTDFIYIDLESVESGKLLHKNIISHDNAPSRAQRVLSKGDVLFQMVRPYQKNNFYFESELSLPSVASTGYAQIRCNDNDPLFVFEQISSDYFSNQAMLRSTGTGYPAINADSLAEIPFIKFPIEEQRKIGKFLYLLSQRIVQEESKLDSLFKVKAAMLQSLFI